MANVEKNRQSRAKKVWAALKRLRPHPTVPFDDLRENHPAVLMFSRKR